MSGEFDFEKYLMRSSELARDKASEDRARGDSINERHMMHRHWAFQDILFTYRQQVLGWSSEELYYGRG